MRGIYWLINYVNRRAPILGKLHSSVALAKLDGRLRYHAWGSDQTAGNEMQHRENGNRHFSMPGVDRTGHGLVARSQSVYT